MPIDGENIPLFLLTVVVVGGIMVLAQRLHRRRRPTAAEQRAFHAYIARIATLRDDPEPYNDLLRRMRATLLTEQQKAELWAMLTDCAMNNLVSWDTELRRFTTVLPLPPEAPPPPAQPDR